MRVTDRVARVGKAGLGSVSAAAWTNTTHDWRALVDEPHVRAVREQPEVSAPGGVRHFLHEVLGYVADEADAVGGTVRVRDHGRGTDTRGDGHGRMIRKPVMATKDLRCLDGPSARVLPDGHPRRGMSVVAALRDWLVHDGDRARMQSGLPMLQLTRGTNEGQVPLPQSRSRAFLLENLSVYATG